MAVRRSGVSSASASSGQSLRSVTSGKRSREPNALRGSMTVTSYSASRARGMSACARAVGVPACVLEDWWSGRPGECAMEERAVGIGGRRALEAGAVSVAASSSAVYLSEGCSTARLAWQSRQPGGSLRICERRWRFPALALGHRWRFRVCASDRRLRSRASAFDRREPFRVYASGRRELFSASASDHREPLQDRPARGPRRFPVDAHRVTIGPPSNREARCLDATPDGRHRERGPRQVLVAGFAPGARWRPTPATTPESPVSESAVPPAGC